MSAETIRLDLSALTSRELAHVQNQTGMIILPSLLHLFGGFVADRLWEDRVEFDGF